MLESTAPGWTELVDKMQATHAAALAEARAEGRRQGLEEAADIAETEEAVRSTGGQSRPAHEAIRDLLPTAPVETQKPETGESHHG